MLIITASSSCYISDDGEYAFSAGGPTAHIHAISENGGIGEQIDELLFIPEQEIPNVDKTRNAVVSLTYNSQNHGTGFD